MSEKGTTDDHYKSNEINYVFNIYGYPGRVQPSKECVELNSLRPMAPFTNMV